MNITVGVDYVQMAVNDPIGDGGRNRDRGLSFDELDLTLQLDSESSAQFQQASTETLPTFNPKDFSLIRPSLRFRPSLFFDPVSSSSAIPELPSGNLWDAKEYAAGSTVANAGENFRELAYPYYRSLVMGDGKRAFASDDDAGRFVSESIVTLSHLMGVESPLTEGELLVWPTVEEVKAYNNAVAGMIEGPLEFVSFALDQIEKTFDEYELNKTLIHETRGLLTRAIQTRLQKDIERIRMQAGLLAQIAAFYEYRQGVFEAVDQYQQLGLDRKLPVKIAYDSSEARRLTNDPVEQAMLLDNPLLTAYQRLSQDRLTEISQALSLLNSPLFAALLDPKSGPFVQTHDGTLLEIKRDLDPFAQLSSLLEEARASMAKAKLGDFFVMDVAKVQHENEATRIDSAKVDFEQEREELKMGAMRGIVCAFGFLEKLDELARKEKLTESDLRFLESAAEHLARLGDDSDALSVGAIGLARNYRETEVEIKSIQARIAALKSRITDASFTHSTSADRMRIDEQISTLSALYRDVVGIERSRLAFWFAEDIAEVCPFNAGCQGIEEAKAQVGFLGGSAPMDRAELSELINSIQERFQTLALRQQIVVRLETYRSELDRVQRMHRNHHMLSQHIEHYEKILGLIDNKEIEKASRQFNYLYHDPSTAYLEKQFKLAERDEFITSLAIVLVAGLVTAPVGGIAAAVGFGVRTVALLDAAAFVATDMYLGQEWMGHPLWDPNLSTADNVAKLGLETATGLANMYGLMRVLRASGRFFGKKFAESVHRRAMARLQKEGHVVAERVVVNGEERLVSKLTEEGVAKLKVYSELDYLQKAARFTYLFGGEYSAMTGWEAVAAPAAVAFDRDQSPQALFGVISPEAMLHRLTFLIGLKIGGVFTHPVQKEIREALKPWVEKKHLELLDAIQERGAKAEKEFREAIVENDQQKMRNALARMEKAYRQMRDFVFGPDASDYLQAIPEARDLFRMTDYQLNLLRGESEAFSNFYAVIKDAQFGISFNPSSGFYVYKGDGYKLLQAIQAKLGKGRVSNVGWQSPRIHLTIGGLDVAFFPDPQSVAEPYRKTAAREKNLYEVLKGKQVGTIRDAKILLKNLKPGEAEKLTGLLKEENPNIVLINGLLDPYGVMIVQNLRAPGYSFTKPPALAETIPDEGGHGPQGTEKTKNDDGKALTPTPTKPSATTAPMGSSAPSTVFLSSQRPAGDGQLIDGAAAMAEREPLPPPQRRVLTVRNDYDGQVGGGDYDSVESIPSEVLRALDSRVMVTYEEYNEKRVLYVEVDGKTYQFTCGYPHESAEWLMHIIDSEKKYMGMVEVDDEKVISLLNRLYEQDIPDRIRAALNTDRSIVYENYGERKVVSVKLEGKTFRFYHDWSLEHGEWAMEVIDRDGNQTDSFTITQEGDANYLQVLFKQDISQSLRSALTEQGELQSDEWHGTVVVVETQGNRYRFIKDFSREYSDWAMEVADAAGKYFDTVDIREESDVKFLEELFEEAALGSSLDKGQLPPEESQPEPSQDLTPVAFRNRGDVSEIKLPRADDEHDYVFQRTKDGPYEVLQRGSDLKSLYDSVREELQKALDAHGYDGEAFVAEYGREYKGIESLTSSLFFEIVGGVPVDQLLGRLIENGYFGAELFEYRLPGTERGQGLTADRSVVGGAKPVKSQELTTADGFAGLPIIPPEDLPSSPKYHLGNSELDANPVGLVVNIPLGAAVEGGYLTHPIRSEPDVHDSFWEICVIRRKAADDSFLELVTPGGVKIYFKRIEPTQEGVLSYQIVNQADTPFESNLPDRFDDSRTREGMPVVNPETRDELASKLAATQERASGTAERVKGGEVRDRIDSVDQVRSNLVVANAYMLGLLLEVRALTSSDLEVINERVNADSLNEYDQQVAGVLRGTRKIKKGDLFDFDVDARNWHIVSRRTDGHVAGHYLPPSEVPTRIAQLLAKINGLNPSSSFREIAKIYREFIVIHPFIEGNGRTARVLLDYCLLKMGRAPLPHSLETRDVLFQSIEEIEARLLQAYGPGAGKAEPVESKDLTLKAPKRTQEEPKADSPRELSDLEPAREYTIDEFSAHLNPGFGMFTARSATFRDLIDRVRARGTKVVVVREGGTRYLPDRNIIELRIDPEETQILDLLLTLTHEMRHALQDFTEIPMQSEEAFVAFMVRLDAEAYLAAFQVASEMGKGSGVGEYRKYLLPDGRRVTTDEILREYRMIESGESKAKADAWLIKGVKKYGPRHGKGETVEESYRDQYQEMMSRNRSGGQVQAPDRSGGGTTEPVKNQELTPVVMNPEPASGEAGQKAEMTLSDGLHARPAVLLVKLLAKFPDCLLFVEVLGREEGRLEIPHDSLFRILSMQIRSGQKVKWTAEGSGADEVLSRIRRYNDNGWKPVTDDSVKPSVVTITANDLTADALSASVSMAMDSLKLAEVSCVYHHSSGRMAIGDPKTGHQAIAVNAGLETEFHQGDLTRFTVQDREGVLTFGFEPDDNPYDSMTGMMALKQKWPQLFAKGTPFVGPPASITHVDDMPPTKPRNPGPGEVAVGSYHSFTSREIQRVFDRLSVNGTRPSRAMTHSIVYLSIRSDLPIDESDRFEFYKLIEKIAKGQVKPGDEEFSHAFKIFRAVQIARDIAREYQNDEVPGFEEFCERTPEFSDERVPVFGLYAQMKRSEGYAAFEKRMNEYAESGGVQMPTPHLIVVPLPASDGKGEPAAASKTDTFHPITRQEVERYKQGNPDDTVGKRYADILNNKWAVVFRPYRTTEDFISALDKILADYNAGKLDPKSAEFKRARRALHSMLVIGDLASVCNWDEPTQPHEQEAASIVGDQLKGRRQEALSRHQALLKHLQIGLLQMIFYSGEEVEGSGVQDTGKQEAGEPETQGPVIEKGSGEAKHEPAKSNVVPFRRGIFELDEAVALELARADSTGLDEEGGQIPEGAGEPVQIPFNLNHTKYSNYDPSHPSEDWMFKIVPAAQSSGSAGPLIGVGEGFGFAIIQGRSGIVKVSGLVDCTRITMVDPVNHIAVDSHLPVYDETAQADSDFPVFEQDIDRLLLRLRALGMNPEKSVIHVVYGDEGGWRGEDAPGLKIAQLLKKKGLKVESVIPITDPLQPTYLHLDTGMVSLDPDAPWGRGGGSDDEGGVKKGKVISLAERRAQKEGKEKADGMDEVREQIAWWLKERFKAMGLYYVDDLIEASIDGDTDSTENAEWTRQIHIWALDSVTLEHPDFDKGNFDEICAKVAALKSELSKKFEAAKSEAAKFPKNIDKAVEYEILKAQSREVLEIHQIIESIKVKRGEKDQITIGLNAMVSLAEKPIEPLTAEEALPLYRLAHQYEALHDELVDLWSEVDVMGNVPPAEALDVRLHSFMRLVHMEREAYKKSRPVEVKATPLMEARRRLALLERCIKNLEKEVADYEKAVKLDPNFESVLTHKRKILEKNRAEKKALSKKLGAARFADVAREEALVAEQIPAVTRSDDPVILALWVKDTMDYLNSISPFYSGTKHIPVILKVLMDRVAGSDIATLIAETIEVKTEVEPEGESTKIFIGDRVIWTLWGEWDGSSSSQLNRAALEELFMDLMHRLRLGF